MLWFALRMMRSPSEQTRLKGATQLGQSKNQRAISALTLALRDRSFRVRAAVVEALESSGWQPEDGWQQALCMTVKGRVEEAAQLGAAAVEPLVVMLKGATLWEQRAKAADTLGRIKSPGAVEALSRALEDGDGSVRLRAARGLGLAGSDQAWDSLVSALADSDNRVREEAIQALATIGGGGTAPQSTSFRCSWIRTFWCGTRRGISCGRCSGSPPMNRNGPCMWLRVADGTKSENWGRKRLCRWKCWSKTRSKPITPGKRG